MGVGSGGSLALLLEGKEVGDPFRLLCDRELLERGSGVPGVCDGRLFEVREADGSLCWRGPGVWRPLSPALAPSRMRIWAQGYVARCWVLGSAF